MFLTHTILLTNDAILLYPIAFLGETGTKMASFQDSKQLAILIPIRVDTPLVFVIQFHFSGIAGHRLFHPQIQPIAARGIEREGVSQLKLPSAVEVSRSRGYCSYSIANRPLMGHDLEAQQRYFSRGEQNGIFAKRYFASVEFFRVLVSHSLPHPLQFLPSS